MAISPLADAGKITKDLNPESHQKGAIYVI